MAARYGCIWENQLHLMVKQLSSMSNWPYPRIVAYRGGGKLAPENTPGGKSTSGAKYGHKMIELTRSYRKMARSSCSTTTLNRDQQRLGRRGELNRQDLLRVDAGSWYSKAFKGEPLPLLCGGGTLSRNYGMMANIEIKTHHWHWTINGQMVALAARQLWPV